MTSTDVQAMIIKLDGITAKLKEIRDFAEDTNNIDPEIQKQVGQNLADIVKDTIKWTDRAIKTAEDHRDKLAKKEKKKAKKAQKKAKKGDLWS